MLLAAGGQPDKLAHVSAGIWPAPVEARRHILPDQHAEAVAVIIVARGLNLDVLPHHVESGLTQPGDLPLHGFVRWRCMQPVGPPALVERTMLENRLAIEQDRRLARD